MRKILLLIFISFVGCATNPVKQKPSFHEIITATIEIHLVSNRNFFEWPKAQVEKNGVVGYAAKTKPVYKIYVLGEGSGRTIYFDQEVMGHELAHILHWENSKLFNPDKNILFNPYK